MRNWKQINIFLLFAFLFLVNCGPKKLRFNLSDLNAPNTTQGERIKFKNELIENTILKNLSYELNSENEKRWQAAFWGMELALYRSDSTFNAIKRAFRNYNDRSESFQRSLLEATYCLFPDEFSDELSRVANETSSPRLFAMAAHYLIRFNPDKRNDILNLLKNKFTNWNDNPILFMLHENLKQEQRERPPLIDILMHSFEDGKTIVYSFQRQDRNHPGITIIKKPDGKFVRSADGRIFHISHLARSISDLPGYITNGNTPQGIFSIQGSDVSGNLFIGQTPNLQLVMPHEVSIQKFFHSNEIADTTWTADYYQQLLPESWKSYFPIYEAFYAGKAGRTEIIAHGTTIDPDFYNEKTYYPNTPSLGCITAKELWSPKNGSCLVSDQLAFINAYRSAGSKEGYLVVIELDDKKKPVVLDEVIVELLKAEGE